jgi:hypothetical protein
MEAVISWFGLYNPFITRSDTTSSSLMRRTSVKKHIKRQVCEMIASNASSFEVHCYLGLLIFLYVRFFLESVEVPCFGVHAYTCGVAIAILNSGLGNCPLMYIPCELGYKLAMI